MNITQAPTLERLTVFEKVSWPGGQQATAAELARRLKAFSAGIFLLSVEGIDVCQVTVSPKRLHGVPDSFESMRDQEVNLNSKILWVTNIATRQGATYQSKGYATQLLTHVAEWAQENGYGALVAGVTCDGFAEACAKGEVQSVEDYLAQNRNPAARTFQKVARTIGGRFWRPAVLKNYWEIDEKSAGYGVLVRIDLKPSTER